MVGDGVVDLLKSGVINNSMKQTLKGKTILGFAFGTRKLFDYIDDNPDVEMYPIEYVNYVHDLSPLMLVSWFLSS